MKTLCLFIILISLIVIFFLQKKENYSLLKNIGIIKYSAFHHGFKRPSSDTSESLKYKGHRYKRRRVRFNPNVRRYQD
jgi:hypothetical protein